MDIFFIYLKHLISIISIVKNTLEIIKLIKK